MRKANRRSKINSSSKPEKKIPKTLSQIELNNHLTIAKENSRQILSFLKGTLKELPENLKESAKIYFLFKLKNEKSPNRHKPPKDDKVTTKYNLYLKYLRKLNN